MLPIRHREQPLRAVALALERLREVDLVELAAAALLASDYFSQI